MSDDDMRKAFDYYLAHQDEIVAEHDGKVIVIVEEEVVGAYSSHVEALRAAELNYEPGTFLIQQVSEGVEGHTATFHSRVAF